jgi:hypothetical protein
MLEFINGIGRCLLSVLMALSWTETALPRARNFTLAGGSLVVGLIPGSIFLLVGRYDPSYQIADMTAFVWLPLGALICVVVIEGIKREIQKNSGQVSR